MREISVGTRGSKLAIAQTEWILAKLRETYPKLKADIVKITTKGDRNSTTALGKFAGQGIFVKELEKALIEGKIDLAVHSLKDLPTEIPDNLTLGAITVRLDPRDVLISRSGKLAELANGSRIGTGSHRRAIQLHALRPDINICSVRGNIDTRIRKVYDNEIDGIIIAAAALIRLGWENKITEYLPVEHFTPAVGQGALVLEIRSGDEEVNLLIQEVNHEPTKQCVIAERTFLKTLGGGCRAPIAALGTISDSMLKLIGMVASADGKHIIRTSEEGDVAAPDQVGRCLANKMIGMGAIQYLTEPECQ